MGLALRFQFLQGSYQAARPGAITDPEWPPHPVRVHAALMAAAWAQEDGGPPADGALAALRWLESIGPPNLTCPVAERRNSPTVYVPRNLTRREVTDVKRSLRTGDHTAFRRQYGRVERTFPTTIVGSEPVYFSWPAAEPEPQIRIALEHLTAYVSYLGSSRSPVACGLIDDVPAPTLVPVTVGGSHSVRVAMPGLTDWLLDNRYASGGIRGGLARYGTPDLDPTPGAEDVTPGPFRSLVVLRRTHGFALTLAHATIVARAFRNAILANAGDDAPAVLHGHGCNPHVAFLPLATVGHPHAGGEIRGFGMAIPEIASRQEEQAIVAAAQGTQRVAITRHIVPWTVQRIPAEARLDVPDVDDVPWTLEPLRWIGPAHVWATATPIVLDRHPRRGRAQTLDQLVRLTFANALLPDPVELELSRTPFVAGAVPVGVHTAHGAPSGALLHVRARFDAPLRGPVLAGRGRYLGTGILVPVREPR